MKIRVSRQIYEEEYHRHYRIYEVSTDDGWDVATVEVEYWMQDHDPFANVHCSDENFEKIFGITFQEWEKETDFGLCMVRPFLESLGMDMSFLDEVYVEPLPWKPQLGEKYWGIGFDIEDNINLYTWCEDLFDENLYDKGLVFQTQEKATKVANKILEVIKC